MASQHSVTFDKDLQLKDAGAVTASAAAQVGGSDKKIDFGAAVRVDGCVIIDISAIDVGSADEKYEIELQLSSDNFTTVHDHACVVKLGDSSVNGKAADDVIGHREIPFTNEQNGVVYRYFRLYHRIAGTTPSINYTAYIARVAAV